METLVCTLSKSVRVTLFYLHNCGDTTPSSKLFHLSLNVSLFYLHVNRFLQRSVKLAMIIVHTSTSFQPCVTHLTCQLLSQ